MTHYHSIRVCQSFFSLLHLHMKYARQMEAILFDRELNSASDTLISIARTCLNDCSEASFGD